VLPAPPKTNWDNVLKLLRGRRAGNAVLHRSPGTGWYARNFCDQKILRSRAGCNLGSAGAICVDDIGSRPIPSSRARRRRSDFARDVNAALSVERVWAIFSYAVRVFLRMCRRRSAGYRRPGRIRFRTGCRSHSQLDRSGASGQLT